MSNPVLQNILNRKSVRHFSDDKVTKEQIEILLRAAMAAPSAKNVQPWAFVVVTERETLDLLADKLPYAKMLFRANAAIVVCGVPHKAGDGTPAGYWVQDCSAATQNILLAAEAIGLGAVWTGVYPRPERVTVVADALNLPEDVIPLNVIPIGVPDGQEKPKDKYKAENVIWNKWQ